MNFRKSSKRHFATKVRNLATKVRDFATKVRDFACVCSFWRDCYILYDPISYEMHLVQLFNMVKTYPEKTLLYHFHAEKPYFICIKGPNFATTKNGLEIAPPPLFKIFQKIIRFG